MKRKVLLAVLLALGLVGTITIIQACGSDSGPTVTLKGAGL